MQGVFNSNSKFCNKTIKIRMWDILKRCHADQVTMEKQNPSRTYKFSYSCVRRSLSVQSYAASF